MFIQLFFSIPVLFSSNILSFYILWFVLTFFFLLKIHYRFDDVQVCFFPFISFFIVFQFISFFHFLHIFLFLSFLPFFTTLFCLFYFFNSLSFPYMTCFFLVFFFLNCIIFFFLNCIIFFNIFRFHSLFPLLLLSLSFFNSFSYCLIIHIFSFFPFFFLRHFLYFL